MAVKQDNMRSLVFGGVAVFAFMAAALAFSASATAVDPQRQAEAQERAESRESAEADAETGQRDDDAGVLDRQIDGRDRTDIRRRDRYPVPNRRWQLGVSGQILDTGMRITRVYPGSPASRVGLERQDIIITVAGQQIGRVDGQLYPLDRALNAYASRSGDVRLLVWNHRDRRLVNVDVQLESRRWEPRGGPRERDSGVDGGVYGQVSFDKSLLPAGDDAELLVLMYDGSRSGGEVNPIAELRIPLEDFAYEEDGNVVMGFQLDENVQNLDPGGRYVLMAYVVQKTDGMDRRILSLARPYRLKRVDRQEVTLRLAP